MHIILAGFGNMGRALARGWSEATAFEAKVTVLDPNPVARELAIGLGLEAIDEAASLSGPCDVAFLAVKPDVLEAVLADLPEAGLYISIAAGRTLADIAAVVGNQAAIVRAMPNTPAAIGHGITGLCANGNVSARDRQTAIELMSAVGSVEWIANESDMNALTAVSGSGPAYVFLLIEALTAAAIDVGLAPDLAARLSVATVEGAGAYAASSDLDAATLRRQVTSPGGTTEAALKVLLESGAFEELLRLAVRAATDRGRELRPSDSGR